MSGWAPTCPVCGKATLTCNAGATCYDSGVCSGDWDDPEEAAAAYVAAFNHAQSAECDDCTASKDLEEGAMTAVLTWEDAGPGCFNCGNSLDHCNEEGEICERAVSRNKCRVHDQ